MNLHKKIQPHHHVAIWTTSVLAVILSASIYTNATVTQAQDSGAQPSQATKNFFGDGESGDKAKQFETPAACTQAQHQTDDTQRMALFAQSGSLNQKISDLQNQLHNAAQDGLTQDQQAQIQAQITTYQAQLADITKQIQALGGQDGSGGASDDCKAALVAQMKVHTDVFSSKIKDTILPRLETVSALLAKISGSIDQMKAEGVDPATIASLQADVAKAQADITTLKSFFNSMYSLMSGFKSHEGSADDAFNYMKQSQPKTSSQTAAANAANDLVKTFTTLQKDIKALAATN